MRILTASDVSRALEMPKAIEVMRDAFAQLAAGDATVPPRPVIEIPDVDASFLTMPAYAAGTPALSVKAVGVFPRNPDKGLAAIQGAVLALDPGTGRPLALFEGASLTAIRTGAASGVATDFLAREDASTLAVFGAGAQARTHVAAVRAVRDIREARVYAPTRSHAEAMAAELDDVDVVVADGPGDALDGADIVCTATNSPTPVFSGDALVEGVHVNAVGSFKPTLRELDLETIRRMDKVVVDTREGAWAEAGELIHARDEGLLTAEGVYAELGDLCVGNKPGRESGDERTLFKSVGNAVQDAVAAQAAYEAALALDLGVEVDLDA